MRFLHSMLRVQNLDNSLHFFCDLLGFVETRRWESEQWKCTLVYLAAPEDAARAKEERAPEIELTYNWESDGYSNGTNHGHLAFEVDNIYDTCAKLKNAGITINRPPHDGWMAFVKTPDGISIELLQKGEKLAPEEPWASMENTGQW